MARYIDADALKHRMFNYYGCVNENTGKDNYRGETLMCYEVADMIEDCIDNAPTADVVPKSEGEWKDQYNGKYANPIYVCSICGKGTLLTPYINELNNMEMTQALSAFCPNCGAKMKGGE